MADTEQFRMHAFISGRVQGVGFRFFTMQAAQDHNITGWVRNRLDGRVELMAEGTQENLNRMLMALRRGPISADVQKVDYEFKDAQGEFQGFRVLSTG
jgi:acylphosphatase